MAAEEEDFTKLAIEDRLAHKSWKARLSAYDSLISLFRSTVSEDDPAFRPYLNGSVVKDWVRDSNAVSQEKGVEAACALVEWGGKTAGVRTRPDVLPSVVEKCLGSSRAGTRAKAVELCLLYVETEEDGGTGVIGDITPGLDVKQPKVVAGSVTVLKEIIRLFGPKTIPPKPILALLPKIFAHADKTVRSEGTLLAIALHSYLGPALDPHLSELKPVQVKELNEAFKERDDKGEGFGGPEGKQSRWTKTQQRERMVKEAEVQLEGGADDEGADGADGGSPPTPEPALDPYDLATPVEVLSRLPEDFYTNLTSTKWKDRQSVLEPLLSLVSTPRLAPGNYDELVRALAGRMTDANVLCVGLAANCLEKIALGLRGGFGGFKGVVLTECLKRTKEKKASVLDALAGALDATFASVTLPDITEEVLTSLKDKNPSVKAETLKFYTRSLKTTTVAPTKTDLPELTAAFSKALEDSQEPIRVAAAEAMGTMMKVVGERAFGGSLDGLDDLRKAKVMEWFEKAEVKYKAGAAPPPAASRAGPPAGGGGAAPLRPKPKLTSMAAAANKENGPPTPASPVAPLPKPAAPKGPPARLLAKKPPAPAAPPAAAAPPAKKPAAPAASSSKAPPPSKPAEPLKYRFSQEDAEAKAEEALPEGVVKELGDSNWKVRLGAIESLSEWLSGGEMANVESELVVRFLSKKPGWKESNFQVSSKMFGIFQLLAEQSPSFAKASAALSIPALSDKLGDVKLKKPAGDALTTFAEKTSLQFVLGQAYEPMTKQKAPKAQADSLVWVDQAIKDFGIGGLAVRELVEFLKVGLKSSNAAVRTSATKTLVTLKIAIGADVSSFLQDLNPTLLTTIEGEFAKVASESPPEPTRFSADNAVAAGPSGGKGGAGVGAGAGDALDDLFPRVDLEKLVSAATISGCNDANWKMRKEALESIQATLEANKRLKPGNLSDLTTALKQRLADSNKVCQGLALDIVARVATGMGKPFDKLARIYATPVAMVLADAKINIRTGGTTALSAIADAAGLDSLIGGLEKPLEAPNPVLRKELLAWLEGRFADESVVATLDLTGIASPVIACLEDKSAEVRKSAAALLPGIISRAGYGFVMDITSKLKPASRNTVVPIIEAARASAPAAAAPTPVAKASAPAPAPPPAMAPPAAKPIGAPRATAKLLRPAASTLPPPSSPVVETTSRMPAVRPRASIGGLRSVKSSAPSSARATPSPASSIASKEPPFRNADADAKRIRGSKETGVLKWVVEGVPRPDQVEALFQQMLPNTSPDLLAQLFSKDHNAERDFGIALTTLDECARDSNVAATYDLSPEEMRARLVANVDVIFKYITLRIGLTSTTIKVKCLDLVEHLIPVLDAENHKLSDYETSALLLSLITTVGDGKEPIRQRVRSLFKSICSVYPFSKVFTTILDNGLISKNARTRSESAEELGSLIKSHGVSSFPISRALPLIAKLISDRDTAVRVAALTAIGNAYTLIGADVYKFVGPIPDKERSMLDERLKRTPGAALGTASAASSPAPKRSATPVQRSLTPVDRPMESSSPSALPRPGATTSSGLPAPRTKIGGIPRIGGGRPMSVAGSMLPTPGGEGTPRKVSGSGLPTMRQAIPRPGSTATSIASTSRLAAPSSRRDPADDEKVSSSSDETARLVESLSASENDLGRSAEILKQIQREIAAQPDFVGDSADALMYALTRQMSVAFTGLDGSSPPPVLRLCKHIMTTLTSFYDHKTLGKLVSTEALTTLLAELTGRLLDTADCSDTEAISSLSKVLNMVLIRIFHHAEQTACFSALFSVLRDATIDLRELRGAELQDRAKYAELVMKCLWKVSKTVKESLESSTLRPSRLLHDINAFLDATPPAEWRRRASDNVPLADMPLRTVKTILQQVVSVFGDQVFDHLDEIEAAENSFVYQYLFRLVNNATGRDPVESAGLSRNPSSGSMASMRSVTSMSSTVQPTSPPLVAVSSPLMRNGSAGSFAEAQQAMPPPSPGGADIELNHALKEIFDMIGDPVNSRQGISDLYNFQKTHPEAEARIATWMAGTGNYFQTYLRRALDNLATADRERGSFPPTPSESRTRSTSSSISRPNSASSSSGTPVRPSSTYSTGGNAANGVASPRTSHRLSMGPGGGSAKLQELKSVFGYSDEAAS
ncbi:microtubule associated protein [Pseudohyphozyma bogoriensis]|nr:microtubule associated protein [Pseudohyphozyma bogoriensis]